MDGRFYHAIWMNEHSNKIIEIYHELVNYLQRFDFELTNNPKCISYAKKGGKYAYALGVAKDNIIIAKMVDENGSMESDKYPIDVWSGLKNRIKSYNPEIEIEGTYNCILLCRDCCDKDPEGFFRRRYCEYFVEGYCALMLADKERDEVCVQYYCSSFREEVVDAFSGPYGLRPQLIRTYAFSQEAKEVLREILTNKNSNIEEILQKYPRFGEVIFYKKISLNDLHLLHHAWRHRFEMRKLIEERCSLENKICNYCKNH